VVAQAGGGTLSVIRTTNGQFPHETSLEVIPPLAPTQRSDLTEGKPLVVGRLLCSKVGRIMDAENFIKSKYF